MQKSILLMPILFLLLSGPQGAAAFDRVDAYINRLDQRVPRLLLRYNIPSAAVAVVHNGQTYTRSWGAADLQTGRKPADTTLYNVGSISKLVTAWSVMRLVQEGSVELDAPVSRYVSRWKLPPSEWSDQVTVRRLLSHTAGLSMPSVPQYAPPAPVPSLAQMLSDGAEPVRILEKPGVSYKYSGGGYGILQLLVEETTKQTFEEFAESAILKPLGMNHSTFRAPGENDPRAATPYDTQLRPLPHYRFAAQGAAGLYTTIHDLAVLASAGMAAENTLPLNPETVALMRARTPTETFNPFGYGLGYSIVPLPAGGESFGHAGSNDGWNAVVRSIPQSGDALAVMLNRSDGFPFYRDLMCEWVESVQGKKWPGFCDDQTADWTDRDTDYVDGLFAGASSRDPAAAVLVATSAGIVYRKAFGSRDLETQSPASPDSPFYIASLTKSLTGLVALKLAEEGRWSLTDSIGAYLPELPPYIKDATLDQLLSHTSGVPDYYGLIDWSRFDGMDNAKAIALLGQRTELEFPGGSQYRYSNSGYLLIAAALERVMGKSYAQILREKVLIPAGMNATFVYDGSAEPPSTRVKGYRKQDGSYVLSDYHIVTIQGKQLPFLSTTYGPGGVYSTVDDLYALDRALSRGDLLALPIAMMATAPRTPIQEAVEVPDTLGHGMGWFASKRYGTSLIWNTGDRGGLKSVFLRVPGEGFTVIVFLSGGGREPEDFALQIADHLLARKR